MMVEVLYRIGAMLAFACTLSLGAPDWTPLFNGKDFTGFYTWIDGKGKNQDPGSYFSVDPDSSIHVYAKAVDGSTIAYGYLATVKEYSHYRIRWQFKWGTKRFAPTTAKRDAGLLYHITGPDQDGWPRCVEFQIQEGDVGDVWALRNVWVTTTVDPNSIAGTPKFMEASAGGVLYEHPAPTDYVGLSKNANYEIAGWNDLEMYVHDDSVVFYTNGKINNRVFKLRQRTAANPDQFAPLIKGKIGFEAEAAEVYYRRIEVMDLTGTTGLPPGFRVATKKSVQTRTSATGDLGFDARGRTSDAVRPKLPFPAKFWIR
jgi:hypothetical protein